MDKEKTNIPIVLIIAIIVIILVLYVASLGQIGGDQIKAPDEFRESREKAQHRHRKLEVLIARQKELKKKLDRRFKRIYFWVRFTLVALWMGLLTGLHFLGLVQNLSDLVLYSNVSLLVIFTMHFITFGSVANLKFFIDMVKTRTENWVYKKYADIDERIKATQNEKILVEKKIEGIDQKEVEYSLPHNALDPEIKSENRIP